MKNLFSLSGKVALVTGGSRGLGAMIARGFVENGVKTYITARNEDELNATVKELNMLGECIAIAADLSTLSGIEALVNTISLHESKLDILVNNAGAAWGAPFAEFPEEGWDKVMNLNAKSPFFVTQKLLTLLSSSATSDSPARVINIASINGINNPKANNYSYAASKAAVIQMTRHLAADLVKDNININAIAPGFFLSKLTKYIVNEQEERFAKKMVPKERLGKAEDIAGTAIYLSSQASSWMTGHTLVLDGGVIASSGYGEL
ncbi:SDR family oxidoreductase [Colwellia demingiae]|uniref:SDR family oxidoreductase n=1 Tax=Colwellia demingiae TaxID=89401 RepID=A0A5C6Q6G6_9GAMM|nr:SDR family NAD(P)-dependent oxidoreductase [Colwellia demingiae]TWX64147.1 SDR family oxidoreductase [Colwellia demingiae]